MSVVDPMDYGAAGNGTTNDQTALQNAMAALPAGGGIIYLPAGKTFKKTGLFNNTTKAHVKWWAPNGQAGLFGSVGGTGSNIQAWKSTQDGWGFFGVVFTGDATSRGNTMEDQNIVADGCDMVEVVGCDISNTRATGMFFFGATNIYVCGNYVHNTWADHIHHTNVCVGAWDWENWIYTPVTGGSQRGDDGIACVTYGEGGSLGRDMEWWDNVILETDWGRGYTVIGGENIHIHHNWAIEVAGAGVLLATETALGGTDNVRNCIVESNYVTRCGHTIGHPGLLVAGDNPDVDPIDNIDFLNNVSAANSNGNYATLGDFTNITNTGLSQSTGDLPTEPTVSDVVLKDTSILCTRDVSHVSSGNRPGLYRIHVRETSPGSGSYQERFEYVVKGTPSNVSSWVSTRTGAGDYLSEQQTVSGTAYALLLCAAPVTLGTGVSEVTHTELRAGDNNGTLSWLWNRINDRNY